MSKCIPILRWALLSGLLCAALAACTASPQVVYYSLLGGPIESVAAKRNEQLILSVGPVTLSEVLKSSQIATGGTNGRFQRSDYHRWAGVVDRDFARALSEQLAGRLGTDRVTVFPGDQQFDANCQVLVDILAMEGDLGKAAILTVRWTLVDPKGKWPPVVRRSHFSQNLTDAGYETWVKAQQHNISRLGEEISVLVREKMRL